MLGNSSQNPKKLKRHASFSTLQPNSSGKFVFGAPEFAKPIKQAKKRELRVEPMSEPLDVCTNVTNGFGNGFTAIPMISPVVPTLDTLNLLRDLLSPISPILPSLTPSLNPFLANDIVSNVQNLVAAGQVAMVQTPIQTVQDTPSDFWNSELQSDMHESPVEPVENDQPYDDGFDGFDDYSDYPTGQALKQDEPVIPEINVTEDQTTPPKPSFIPSSPLSMHSEKSVFMGHLTSSPLKSTHTSPLHLRSRIISRGNSRIASPNHSPLKPPPLDLFLQVEKEKEASPVKSQIKVMVKPGEIPLTMPGKRKLITQQVEQGDVLMRVKKRKREKEMDLTVEDPRIYYQPKMAFPRPVRSIRK